MLATVMLNQLLNVIVGVLTSATAIAPAAISYTPETLQLLMPKVNLSLVFVGALSSTEKLIWELLPPLLKPVGPRLLSRTQP